MTFVLLALPAAAEAAQPDYFPLTVGNQWVYRPSRGGEPLSIEITGTVSAGGAEYYVVQGFGGGDVWLRSGSGGTLYKYDSASGREVVWAAFDAAEGQPYATGIGVCNPTARVRSRTHSAEIPIGRFDMLLAIDYPPAMCSDAGLTSELYLPSVGLVQRTQTSIAGPVVYDLVYARLAPVVAITAPETGFSVSAIPQTSGPLLVRMTLRNTGSDPISLTFASGQRYDVVLRDEKGSAVYKWSDGRAFTLLYGTQKFTGEKTWVVSVPVANLARGSYTVEAWLTSTPVIYRAQTSLELK